MDSFHKKVLQYHVPTYLFEVCQSVEPMRQKFRFIDINNIDVIHFHDMVHDNEWGVGLHVTLFDGRHFIMYLSFQDAQIHKYMDGYWEEVHESLNVVEEGCEIVPTKWYRGCNVIYSMPW